MSRGLGSTQRAILALLMAQAVRDDPTGVRGWRQGLKSAEIAEALARSQAQVREACAGLEQRGLVFIERGAWNKPGGRRFIWLPEDYMLKEASWARFLGKTPPSA